MEGLKEPKELIPFVIKYDYEDMIGFGATIVFAESMEMAVDKFIYHMNETKNSNWLDYSHNRETFRWVSKNIFGWNIYFNQASDICLKVRQIETRYGDIIPIQEHFENCVV